MKTIIYNALLGLNFLHQLGIVHRDIKPANLLMNDECQIIYCDFGMARFLPAQNNGMDQLRSQYFGAVKEASVKIGHDQKSLD